VTHLQTVITSSANSGPLARSEDDDLALLRRDRLSTGLRPWPLLDEEKLAAGVIDVAPAQEAGELEGKGDRSIEVLVQAVIATHPIAEQ
jgi:hypothetical protein